MPGEERRPQRDRFSLLDLLLVVGVAFGSSVYYSVLDVVHGTTVGTQEYDTSFSTEDTYATVIDQLIAVPFLVLILYLGGWRLKDFRLGISLRMTAIGVVIFVACYVLQWLIPVGMQAMFPYLHSAIDAWASFTPRDPPGLLPVVILAIVNPIFEEVFACAFVIKILHRRIGLTAAIWASALLRTSYHLYQGLTAAPIHLVYGLVHGHVFARYGRLWPIIFAHSLSNLTAGLWSLS